MLLRVSLTAAAGIGAGSAVLAGTADSKFRVSAATAADSKEVSSNSSSSSDVKKQAKHQIRACELPIYEEPAAVEFEIVPVKPSAYYQAISDARKWVWTYTDSIKDTTKQVTDTYDLAKKYSLDGLQYIQKDSGTVPRAIFISVSGLFGIVFAYRGGFIRKTLYATTAMAGAASICYPNEARDISTRGWKAARGIIITAYKDLSGLPANEPLEKTKSPVSAESVKWNQAPQTDKVSTSEQKTVQVKSTSSSSHDVKDSKSNAAESKKDFGMSNPDDKDLYSTRGK